jgi:protein involved in polysaccharide export with SLBB domain
VSSIATTFPDARFAISAPQMAADDQRATVLWLSWLTLLLCLTSCGCVSHVTRITSACDAVPAYRLPPQLLAESRCGKVPIDFTLLRQQPPETYVISPGDTLGIYVQGIVPSAANEQAPLYTNIAGTRDAYPATGLIHAPVVGLPMRVDEQGKLDMPLVDAIQVRGMTLTQAAQALRKSYVSDHNILQDGRDRIIVTLIKPRVHRVLVIREDVGSPNAPSFYNPNSVPYTKRGSAEILDLPAYENDVLHALVASGGLPGIDAHNSVWVLHSKTENLEEVLPTLANVNQGGDPREVLGSTETTHRAVQIPLRVVPGAPICFSAEDVLLQTGDVVFLQSRDDEVFFTGGLLPGCQLPLPRDRDLDIIAAIAMSTAAAGGPAGVNGASLNFRSQGTGGIINPTKAIVIRRLPNGEQVKIHVDLNRAVVDSRERLIIQPQDFVMLQFTPSEFAGNFVLSLLRTNIIYTP